MPRISSFPFNEEVLKTLGNTNEMLQKTGEYLSYSNSSVREEYIGRTKAHQA